MARIRAAALVASSLLFAQRARADDPQRLTVYGTPGGWEGHATSTVSKRDLDERLPRSAPDALRFEPGVFVQQTSHGQGSPFLRGRTGQQTLLLFDGIRLNNSTYRQGPNQYLFTVDARTIQALEVLRGGASTVHGSDAIGGAVHVRPIEPRFDDDVPGVRLRPRAMLRYDSSATEFGERFQLDAQLSPIVQILGGVGFRRAHRLRSGGAVKSPVDGSVPQVPAFDDDGKTQLGTGFAELTSDLRAVIRLAPDKRLVAAAYLYRQYDAPRTDQCPPPLAPRSECLTYDEQFRTLAYVAFEGALSQVFPASRVALSYQRQHERRTRRRPSSHVENGGRDDVDTFGVVANLESKTFALADAVAMRLGFGGDLYFDRIASTAYTRFTDVELVVPSSRGQYLNGSRYAQGGFHLVDEATFARRLVTRIGGRVGFASAATPADVESGSLAVARTWPTTAAFLQLEWLAHDAFSLLASVDRSFRAPNLDDLTSRQQAGPGFQFENAALRPELAYTFEAGARLRLDEVMAEAWVFRSIVDHAMTRVVRNASDCPPQTPQCGGSTTRFQLVNVEGPSIIDGLELAARVRLARVLTLRATFAYAIGRGPNPQARPTNPALPYEETVPLSRVAPLNGTFEARWSFHPSAYVGGAVRWALAQTRLAPSDRSDARIPLGGTPGFAVFDLRAGYRVRRNFVIAATLENVLDAAYRYHGSSINGAGRCAIVSVESGF